jgi:hypothetical protein
MVVVVCIVRTPLEAWIGDWFRIDESSAKVILVKDSFIRVTAAM